MKLEEMTRPQVEEYLKKDDRIIISLGAIEQHGVGLPLGTDTFIAEALSNKLSKELKIIQAPTIRPGLSLCPHLAFAGTISTSVESLSRLLSEYVDSLYYHGFRKFIILSGHGGNNGILLNSSQEFTAKYEDAEFLYLDDWWKLLPEKYQKNFSSHGHACSEEGSMLAAVREDLVDWETCKKDKRKMKPSKTLVSLKNVKKKLTDTGSINGTQCEINKEVGKEMFNFVINLYKKRIIKSWE